MDSIIKKRFSEFNSTLEQFYNVCHSQIYSLAQEIFDLFDKQRKLLICGNGGSAADAQHIAAEFVSSYSFGLERKSLPAIAISTDSSIMTAISNDFGFNMVFGRQVQGLGIPGDALLIISTSGESENCIYAAECARNIGMKVYALTCADSTLDRIADVAVSIPSKNTQYIQQCHIIAYHIVVELIENFLVKKSRI